MSNARENRARRAAMRQGLVIEKSRQRDPRGLDYQGWRILSNGRVIAGDAPGRDYALTLDEVETHLRWLKVALPATRDRVAGSAAWAARE
jgi:hypothetical protein